MDSFLEKYMFFEARQGGVRGGVIIRSGKGEVDGGVTFLIYGVVSGGVSSNSEANKVAQKLCFQDLRGSH